ncbi:MAG: hypothetical protein K2O07_03505, partial [Alistipes sp.]|nr:hypothetical protein [Alistipes sp.]
TVALAALCAGVLAIVFVFLPWCKYGMNEAVSGLASAFGAKASLSANLGITLWYGILGFIFAAVAVAGTLYKQHALAFWAAILCVLMGLIGWVSLADCTITTESFGHSTTHTAGADEIKESLDMGIATVNHIGAILFFFSGLVVAACSFLLATGKKVVFNVK